MCPTGSRPLPLTGPTPVNPRQASPSSSNGQGLAAKPSGTVFPPLLSAVGVSKFSSLGMDLTSLRGYALPSHA